VTNLFRVPNFQEHNFRWSVQRSLQLKSPK